jgi:hypothetical protein
LLSHRKYNHRVTVKHFFALIELPSAFFLLGFYGGLAETLVRYWQPQEVLQETRPGTMNYLVPVTLIFKPNRKL